MANTSPGSNQSRSLAEGGAEALDSGKTSCSCTSVPIVLPSDPPTYMGSGAIENALTYLHLRIQMHRKIATIDEATRMVSSVLSAVDRASPDEFLAFLASECEFRFATNPPIRGGVGIRAALLELFAATDAIEHTWTDVWPIGAHIIVRGTARYVFKAGGEKTVPYCEVWRLDDDGKINQYEIYCDMNG